VEIVLTAHPTQVNRGGHQGKGIKHRIDIDTFTDSGKSPDSSAQAQQGGLAAASE